MSLKILQLCKKLPFPLISGEAIAVNYLSKAMHEQGCTLTLLAMNTSKHHVEISSLKDAFDHYNDVHIVDIDNRVTPAGALKNLLKSESYHVERFVSEVFKKKLIEILSKEQFDIIQMETLYMAPYFDVIREHSDALIVMRAHNVEHEIWDRITSNTKFLPKKWYLSYLAKKLKRFELDMLNNYDYLVPISEKDLEKFRVLGYKNGAQTIPVGLSAKDYVRFTPKNATTSDKVTVSFIGSFDWMPNLQGVEWFLENIWPSLEGKFPQLELQVAGRHMPDSLHKYASDTVKLVGDVEDARAFINSHPVMIVPLLSGSGTRVKILEGMALGRTIITTTLGCEGIPGKDREELLIADNLQQYIDAFTYYFEQPEQIQRLQENARDFIRDHYNHTTLAELLIDSYKSYISKHKEYAH